MNLRKILFAALVILALSACSDPDGARRILEGNGYSNVEITGYEWFGCSDESDFYSTGFHATAPGGNRVEGVVCAGLFKGATIRFF